MEETQIGRYVILKEIGRGGQSRAYLARDPAIERTVAIKQIRAVTELPEETRAEFVTRFLQEARVAGTLSHPNIVSIYDMGEGEDGPYIVMEFVDGQTLDGIIERSNPADRQAVIPICLQICSGLSFAHQHGVVHRDVKPANIMLTRDGLVKLVDFGIARMASTNLTQTGTLLGTPSYMSPEQIRGEKVDQRADIFSLGIVLYEVLTGRLPFEGENPTTMIFRIVNDPHPPLGAVDAALAGDFGPIIDRCLEKSAVDRYQDCHELAEDLSRLLPGDGAGEDLFDKTMGTAAAISRAWSETTEIDSAATLVGGSQETLLAETAVTTYEGFLSYFPEDEPMMALKEQMKGRIAQASQLRQVENLAVRGQTALAEGKLDEAARIFERILRAAPNDAYAARMLGKTHAANGDVASARRYLERAVSLSPLDPTVQLNLADVLEPLGEYEAAATAIQRAIGLGAAETAGPGVLEARLEALKVRKELKSLLPLQSNGRHTHFLKRSAGEF